MLFSLTLSTNGKLHILLTAFYHRCLWVLLKFIFFFDSLFMRFLQDNQDTHPGNFFHTYHPKVIYNITKQYRFDIPTIMNIVLVHLYQMCLQILNPIELRYVLNCVYHLKKKDVLKRHRQMKVPYYCKEKVLVFR